MVKAKTWDQEAKTLSGRIRLSMAAVGLRTPTDLARKMKINRQTVHKWMTGRSDKLTPDMLFKLADALEVNARWLALGAPYSPLKMRQIDPETAELVALRENLPPQLRDAFLSHGRELLKLSDTATRANPFPALPVKK